MKRWKAVAVYRSDKAGLVDVTHEIEELDELHQLIEQGPDWNTIVDITITLNRVNYPGDTIEKAQER